MSDAIEEYVTFKIKGLQEQIPLFEEAVKGVKKYQESLETLARSQASLQKQYNSAPASQQPSLTKALNQLDYQIDLVSGQRDQAQKIADQRASDMRLYEQLSRQVQEIQRARTNVPPPSAPIENMSLGALQDYSFGRGELERAQQKFARARTDTSKQKWAGEIDRLQSELEDLPSQLVTSAYKKPLEEIRQRVRAFAEQKGRAANNAEFLQIEHDVSRGQVTTIDESAEITARREAAQTEETRMGRLRGYGKKMLGNLTEGGGINLGFSVMFGASQIANAITPALSGERYTPEAQERGMAGLLPTAGGILGTAVGGFGGQMIGGGIGQIAETLFDAKSQRDEALRTSGEEISSALGRGAAAGKAFSAVIEDSAKKLGVPVVELAASLTQISHAVGGLNIAGASSLQATLQSQLGDQYAGTVGAQIKATTAPFSQSYRDMLAGKTPRSGAAYSDMADYYDALGDRDTADQLRTVAGGLGNAPSIAQLNAKINAAREDQKHNLVGSGGAAHALALTPLGSLIPGVSAPAHWVNGKLVYDTRSVSEKQIDTWSAQRDALQQQAANATAASPAKAAGDALADALQNARDQASMGQSQAAGFSASAQQALDRGEGVAGLRRYAGQQTDALTYSQQGLLSQQSELVDKLHTIGVNSPDAGMFKALLADVREKLADVTGSLQDVGIGIFREDLSEKAASAQGTLARLGVRGQSLIMSGVSVDDSRTQSVYGSESAAMRAEAARLTALALDRSNSLGPEAREQDRTQAAQIRFQASKALPLEIFNRQQSEQQANQNLRVSGVDFSIARAQAHGSAGDVVAAMQSKLAEVLRQEAEAQDDILTMTRQNLGTIEQRKAIEAKLLSLKATEVQLQQQITENGYAMVTGQASAASGAGTALARRLTFGAGTTGQSFSANVASFTAGRQNVESLRQAVDDPRLDPKGRPQRMQAYEEAASQLDDSAVSGFGTFTESVQVRSKRQAYEGLSRRMAASPFQPGDRLGLTAKINALDVGKEGGIRQQMARLTAWYNSGRSGMTRDDYDNSMYTLQGQMEDTETAVTERSASVAEQMFSNTIALSSNSTSFASRLLASPMDAAAAAQRVGLGPQAARVFGFTGGAAGMKTYRDTMTFGLAPSDINMKAYGNRPGDFGADLVSVGGWDAPGKGGSKAGDSASDLASLQTLVAQQVQMGNSLIHALTAGFHGTITLNDANGKALTSTIINAGKSNNSVPLLKGGASAPPGGKPFGW